MDSLTDIDFLSKYDEYKNSNKESIEKLIVFLNSLTVNENYHNKKNDAILQQSRRFNQINK